MVRDIFAQAFVGVGAYTRPYMVTLVVRHDKLQAPAPAQRAYTLVQANSPVSLYSATNNTEQPARRRKP